MPELITTTFPQKGVLSHIDLSANKCARLHWIIVKTTKK